MGQIKDIVNIVFRRLAFSPSNMYFGSLILDVKNKCFIPQCILTLVIASCNQWDYYNVFRFLFFIYYPLFSFFSMETPLPLTGMKINALPTI